MGDTDAVVLHQVPLAVQQLIAELLLDGAAHTGQIHLDADALHLVHVLLLAAEGDSGGLHGQLLGHVDIALRHVPLHAHLHRHALGVEGGHLDGDGGAGALNADVVDIDVVGGGVGVGHGVGPHRGDAGEVHLDPHVAPTHAADNGPGPGDGEINGGVLPVHQHQSPAGQGVLRADELHRHGVELLGNGIALDVVHVQPEYDGQQQGQGQVQDLIDLFTHPLFHRPFFPCPAGPSGPCAFRPRPPPAGAAARCAAAAPGSLSSGGA